MSLYYIKSTIILISNDSTLFSIYLAFTYFYKLFYIFFYLSTGSLALFFIQPHPEKHGSAHRSAPLPDRPGLPPESGNQTAMP